MLAIGNRTLIMGIINITPDSFYDGGKYFDLNQARQRAKELASAGADIIDLGGESSRPGALHIDLETELKRVIPVIEKLAADIDIPISIDTTKAEVARQALARGAKIINDISACRFDPQMIKIAADYNASLVLMHMQKTPQDMQINPSYHDVVSEIIDFFCERTSWAISNGVNKENIILDPGIGFGKLPEHNLIILNHLEEFTKLGYPLLIGPSRKSFIGNILGPEATDRLWGTTAAVAIAVIKGAKIIRVHDVAEMRQLVKVAEAIRNNSIAN